ncbi:Bug family tripartite tricarboxylate transporter substrate binding protein [Reyranella sp.]|uniref:Bug family tripartite tricarboxylate transporter substrate binding protein n=1 Tax=Reyranella sp. TaxID=1929291 RepID=UPI0037833D89
MTDLRRRSTLAGLLALAGATAIRDEACAADWPDRPITLIVPFPAGGGSDLFARPIAARMATALSQTIVVDNRSGAGGTIGTAVAARAVPDGYTLLLGDTGLVYAPTIYQKPGFDFGRDFAPLSALARVPYVLVVNPARLDVSTLAEFIVAARKAPGGIDIGSAGVGTLTHLAIGLFEERTGVRLNHVPYRGGAPMLQDLLAGQISAAFVLSGVVAPHVADGKLRGLAIANRRREPILANVPTMHEAGVKELRTAIWFGLFAPAATPGPILDRLHGAAQNALRDPEIRRLWAEQGARVELESRAEFASFVARESERWNRVAKAANVRLE